MPTPSLIPQAVARRPCHAWLALQVRKSTTGRKPKQSSGTSRRRTKPSSSSSLEPPPKSHSLSPPKSLLLRGDKKLRTPVAPYEEPPILTPGSPAASSSKPYYHQSPHSTRGGGSYRGGHVLPTVNVAALLDPRKYCRKSAFYGGNPTIHGTEATRRLIRGKDTALQVLRDEVHKKKKNQRPLSYAVMGHGVPPQLLQDHINMADSLLMHHDFAAECSFHNFHGRLKFDWMRVRRRDGSNKAFPWPPAPSKTHSDWEQQMALYLTVMNRITSNLGLVLSREPSTNNETVVLDEDNQEDDDFVLSSSPLDPSAPSHWNAELLRGTAYPPHLLPSPEGYEGPLPVVEWTPRDGNSAPGYVCIRLQGTASDESTAAGASTTSLRRKKRVPVTLVFDACFRSQSE